MRDDGAQMSELTRAMLARPDRVVPPGGRRARRAAVLGSPVTHSRSPDLHLAAYRALGLSDWTYTRRECTAAEVARVVADADESWVGFSVTMPGKLAALEVADERTDRAVLVGSANTLVRTPGGWRADCTDIDGVVGALAAVGVTRDTVGRVVPARALVIGSGGTARPAVAALAAIGITDLVIVARSAERAAAVVAVAQRLAMGVTLMEFADSDALRGVCAEVAVTVSTVPADGAAPLASALAGTSRLVDVIYDPWPTPLAAQVRRAGGEVVGGLVMLLNQALSQVEQFTGYPAPQEAMAAAVELPAPND